MNEHRRGQSLLSTQQVPRNLERTRAANRLPIDALLQRHPIYAQTSRVDAFVAQAPTLLG